eukprot:scaffold195499_cov31-Tisochrysis_lutea.AAC.5
MRPSGRDSSVTDTGADGSKGYHPQTGRPPDRGSSGALGSVTSIYQRDRSGSAALVLRSVSTNTNSPDEVSLRNTFAMMSGSGTASGSPVALSSALNGACTQGMSDVHDKSESELFRLKYMWLVPAASMTITTWICLSAPSSTAAICATEKLLTSASTPAKSRSIRLSDRLYTLHPCLDWPDCSTTTRKPPDVPMANRSDEPSSVCKASNLRCGSSSSYWR